MKSSKVTQKLDANTRKAILLATEMDSVERIEYQADWSNFPNSLQLDCYLVPNSPHTLAPNSEQTTLLIKKIQQCFLKQGIKFRDFKRNIRIINNDDIKQ